MYRVEGDIFFVSSTLRWRNHLRYSDRGVIYSILILLVMSLVARLFLLLDILVYRTGIEPCHILTWIISKQKLPSINPAKAGLLGFQGLIDHHLLEALEGRVHGKYEILQSEVACLALPHSIDSTQPALFLDRCANTQRLLRQENGFRGRTTSPGFSRSRPPCRHMPATGFRENLDR